MKCALLRRAHGVPTAAGKTPHPAFAAAGAAFRIGHRHYFPAPNAEVMPAIQTLAQASAGVSGVAAAAARLALGRGLIMASKFDKAADAFRDAATAAASAGALEPEASAWFNLAMVQQQLEPGKLVSSVEKGLAVVAKAEEAGEAASVAVVKCELELLKAVAGLYESVVDAAAIDQLRAAQPECAPASAVGWVVANVGSSGNGGRQLGAIPRAA